MDDLHADDPQICMCNLTSPKAPDASVKLPIQHLQLDI